MNLRDFCVTKVLGAGKFSVVYEAICTAGKYRDTRFAIKRLFCRNSTSIAFAVHEREIYERIGLGNTTSPFVSTLFWAIGGHDTPSLIITLGGRYDLHDVVISRGPLSEENARFYVSEIICGLEYLHRKGIVHGDIKPENVSLSARGHVLITDFDQAWDLTNPTKSQETMKQVGTYDYMAPEVARNKIITPKADVWCLGSTTVHLVSYPFRPDYFDYSTVIKMAKEGKYVISESAHLSEALMEFLSACLCPEFKLRIELSDLKYLEFFQGIDWEKLGACQLEPPIKLSDLTSVSTFDFTIHPTSPLLLESITGSKMPNLYATYYTCFPSVLQYLPPDSEAIAAAADESMEKYLQDYNYANPSLAMDAETEIQASEEKQDKEE